MFEFYLLGVLQTFWSLVVPDSRPVLSGNYDVPKHTVFFLVWKWLLLKYIQVGQLELHTQKKYVSSSWKSSHSSHLSFTSVSSTEIHSVKVSSTRERGSHHLYQSVLYLPWDSLVLDSLPMWCWKTHKLLTVRCGTGCYSLNFIHHRYSEVKTGCEGTVLVDVYLRMKETRRRGFYKTQDCFFIMNQ
jgi:hypothetical protein